jgi:predicted permease
MIVFLRGLFLVVLASMLWVTTWASLRCPLFAVPREVYAHPWFIATLFDAYWGFLTFFVWVGYKETSRLARSAWLVAILLLGNLAMAAYCLAELFRVPGSGRVADVLTRRRDGIGVLGPTLAAIGTAVVAFAWSR